ncbi:hypothetical protein [Bartonella sp. CB189]|uniref:hypothetical protein n=1 Tax=Bartonella sp. CB189 TaxID=3112254 RepID=UPI002F9665E4
MSRAMVMITLIIVVALSSFFYGRFVQKNKALIQAVSAFQNREKINDEILALSPFNVCLALGGMPDECASVVHGMDKTSRH